MTEQERDIVKLLGEVWNRFLDLPERNEWDKVEFMLGIHQLQNMIAARSVWENESIMSGLVEDELG